MQLSLQLGYCNTISRTSIRETDIYAYSASYWTQLQLIWMDTVIYECIFKSG